MEEASAHSELGAGMGDASLQMPVLNLSESDLAGESIKNPDCI